MKRATPSQPHRAGGRAQPTEPPPCIEPRQECRHHHESRWDIHEQAQRGQNAKLCDTSKTREADDAERDRGRRRSEKSRPEQGRQRPRESPLPVGALGALL